MTAIVDMASVMSSYNLPLPDPSKIMKAAQWMGTRNMEVGVVPKPMITDAGDAIVQITYFTNHNLRLDDSIDKATFLVRKPSVS